METSETRTAAYPPNTLASARDFLARVRSRDRAREGMPLQLFHCAPDTTPGAVRLLPTPPQRTRGSSVGAMQPCTNLGPRNRFHAARAVLRHSPFDFGGPRIFDPLIDRLVEVLEKQAS